jgi:hypothetical protein
MRTGKFPQGLDMSASIVIPSHVRKRNAFLDEICGIDAKAAIAVAIVRTPKSKEPASGGLQHLSAWCQRRLRPWWMQGRFDQISFIACPDRITESFHHPINRAAARYHSASAAGM